MGIVGRIVRPSAVVALLLAISCGNRPSVDDYAASCVTDEDCVLVSEWCSYECQCASGVLNTSSSIMFNDDVELFCDAQVLRDESLCSCVETRALCEQGVCTRCLVEDRESGGSLPPCSPGT